MTQRRTSGVANRPRANGEERWEEIVIAAAKIFSQKGYEATSLQDIANAVGLLKGSMYYYIKNKEDLLFELIQRALNVQMPVLAELEAYADAPAPERLREFIRRWMGFNRTHRLWARVAESEFSRLRGKRYLEVVAQRDKFSAHVKEIIEQGKREGAFDPSVNTSVVTSSLFELMNTTGNWFKPSGDLSFAELAEWYATFVIRGIGGPDFTTTSAPSASPAGK